MGFFPLLTNHLHPIFPGTSKCTVRFGYRVLDSSPEGIRSSTPSEPPVDEEPLEPRFLPDAHAWLVPEVFPGKKKNGAIFQQIWVLSLKGGTSKSSILIGFSIINHPIWGNPPFLETPIFGL